MTVRELFTYRILTVSNVLSISRILGIPAMWYILAHPHGIDQIRLYTFLTLLFMAATDFFDGYLARKLGQETPLGQYLDPIADKIVIISGLFLLVVYRDFPLWVTILVALREIAGTVGGGFLLIKRNVLGKPNYWGKVGVAMVSLSGLFYLFSWPLREYTIPPLLFVFAGGVFAYARTYGRTVFKG
ncbi:MAG: CDP-diacylglycerol--glycerol-3-phosphate 3-phosphatidyltransferase [Turneriella sp.]|nr:CDP-diacylglycerol--glycerol-3-phosphate 3-phosphatidyltransferase [Turneriella sp.]